MSVDDLLARAREADDALETAYWVGEAKRSAADPATVTLEADDDE